jgi:hypothetical protein
VREKAGSEKIREAGREEAESEGEGEAVKQLVVDET